MYEICMIRGQSYTTYEIEANAINLIADGRVVQFLNGDKIVFAIGVNNLIYYKYVEPRPVNDELNYKNVKDFFAEFASTQTKEQIHEIQEKMKKSKFDKYFSPKKK